MRDRVLRLSQPLLQIFVLVKQFLNRISFISQVNTKLLPLLRQVRHILPQLVSIQTELPELFVFVGQRLVVVLHFGHLRLQSGNHG